MGDTREVSDRLWRASESAASDCCTRSWAPCSRELSPSSEARAFSTSAPLALPVSARRWTRARSWVSCFTLTFSPSTSAAALARAASAWATWAA